MKSPRFRDERHRLLAVLLGALALLSLAACSTGVLDGTDDYEAPPTPFDHADTADETAPDRPELIGDAPELSPYFKLEPEAKKAYVTLFPWLPPRKREDALQDPEAMLHRWMENRRGFREKLRSTDPSQITGMEISGTPRARAWLRYSSGKRAEITDAASWSVEPSRRAKIEKGALQIRCSTLPVTLSATFLDVATRSIDIPSPSAVVSLSLRQPQAYANDLTRSRSEYLQLELTGRCADGSQGEVSCEAKWSVDESAVAINECGRLRIPPSLHPALLHIRAELAGHVATLAVPIER